jgi:hypothetical protein
MIVAKSCRKMRKKVFIMLRFETAFGLLGLDGFVSLVLEIHAVD